MMKCSGIHLRGGGGTLFLSKYRGFNKSTSGELHALKAQKISWSVMYLKCTMHAETIWVSLKYKNFEWNVTFRTRSVKCKNFWSSTLLSSTLEYTRNNLRESKIYRYMYLQETLRMHHAVSDSPAYKTTPAATQIKTSTCAQYIIYIYSHLYSTALPQCHFLNEHLKLSRAHVISVL